MFDCFEWSGGFQRFCSAQLRTSKEQEDGVEERKEVGHELRATKNYLPRSHTRNFELACEIQTIQTII